MNSQSIWIPENPEGWIMCDRHPACPVVFVCISHKNCPYQNLMCMECHDEQPKNHEHHPISLNKFELFNSLYAEKAASSLEEVREALYKLRNRLINYVDVLIASHFGIVDDSFTVEDKFLRERLLREKIRRVACRPIWSKIQYHKTRGTHSLELEHEIQQDVQANSEGIFNLVNIVLNAFDDNARTSSSELAQSHEPDQSEHSNSSTQKRSIKKKQPNQQAQKQPSRMVRPIQKARSAKQFTEEQKLRIVNKIGKNMSKSRLAKVYNIAYSTLRKWELGFTGERALPPIKPTPRKRKPTQKAVEAMMQSEDIKEQE